MRQVVGVNEAGPLPRSHTAHTALAQKLSTVAFAGLRRSDQRRKAEQYVRGLLEVPGRKSIRGIAHLAGDRSLEQGLQHFVSDSTWLWSDMRAALAHYLHHALRPHAWVIRPLLIPKAGSHSVGVARKRLPTTGRTLNCQEAYGAWLARHGTAVPAHWELHLPAEWLDSPARRRDAGIPEHLRARHPLRTAVAAARELDGWGLERRPVVLDCGEDGAALAAGQLVAARLPFIARVDPRAPLLVDAHSTVPGFRQAVSAQQVLNAARRMRRPVEWIDPVSRKPRTSLVARVPTTPHTRSCERWPQRPGGTSPRGPFWLLGEWGDPQGELSHAWLTDLADAPADELLRLTKLTHSVDRDVAGVSDQVGLRDFEGRTYAGWHRHATLASVAHAVVALSRAPHHSPSG